MKVVFFGTPQFAVPSLEALLAEPTLEVIAVVTQPDKRRGRGNQLTPPEVKKVALENQLPVWQPKRVKKSRQTINQLIETNADAFVVVAYGQILSQEILQIPTLGCINVHGSLLPQYRGAAPIQWSIYNGDRLTGVTTMQMDEGMDTGPMLLKATTPIGLLDNAEQLGAILAKLGADLALETLAKLEKGHIQAIAQDNSGATYAPLIQNHDYEIDWSKTAITIHNQIRAFYPNCFTNLGDKYLKINATIPVDPEYFNELPKKYKKIEQNWANLAHLTGKPGEIVALVKSLGPVIQTGKGLLLLREVQPAGKKTQSGWDLVNGARLTVGDQVGPQERG